MLSFAHTVSNLSSNLVKFMSQIVWIQIIVTAAILCIALAEALVLQHRKPGSFDWSEAWLSLADMAGRRMLDFLSIGIAIPVFSWVWTQRLFTIELSGFATFVLLFLGLEFFYYWYHRASHRIRFFGQLMRCTIRQIN